MLADHQTKVAILLIAFLLMVAITYWQPMLGVLVYLSSIGLDYLLSQFGFNTSQTISVGQGMLVTLTLTVMLKQHLAACKSLSKVEFTPKLMKFSVYSSLFEGN